MRRLYAADAPPTVAYIVYDYVLPQDRSLRAGVSLKVDNDLIGIAAGRRLHPISRFAPRAFSFGLLVAAAAVVGARSNWCATEHRMDAQAVVGSMAAASTGAQHGDVVHASRRVGCA